MKIAKPFRCALLLLVPLMLCIATPLSAQAVEKVLRSVQVTGQAEIKVVPDEVVIQVGVESRDAVLATARHQNDAAVARILATARKAGVEAKYLQTGYIRVEPRYQSNSKMSTAYESTKIEYYVVTKEVAVILRDVSKFEGLLSAMLDEGANKVNGVQFNSTELRKHRDRARQMAVIAAREKAQALATELGQKVGKAMSITENTGWQFGGPRMMMNASQNVQGAAAGGDGEGGSSVALGQISISATVNVQFELE